MGTVEGLATDLLRVCQQSDSQELRIILHQLVETVNTPGNISCLIGPVVKSLPSHNFNVKKTAYSVLPRLCSLYPDTAFLAANTVRQDCKDPNPLVKTLAITTLCSLPPLFQEHAAPVLDTALKDSHPRVRQTAVIGCSRVFRHSPQLLFEQGFVDRLYEIIRDTDPVVVTNSLLALDTILAPEGGIVVKRNMAMYLLKRLGDFPDPQLATVIQVIGKYEPQDEEELFQELSVLDPYLVHSTSAAVVINCTKLFFKLTEKKHPQLKSEIIERVVPVLKTFLLSGSPRESKNHVLDFLIVVSEDRDWLDHFADTPNLFYPQKYDTELVPALKKLKILPYICRESNYRDILQNLEDKYCRTPKTLSEAIACVCSISTRMPLTISSECLKVLITLMDSNESLVCNNVLSALQDFNLDGFTNDEIRSLIRKVLMKVDLSLEDVPYILPILLGQYGELIEDESPYVLESLVNNFDQYNDNLQNLVFNAAIKMFLKMPAKCQHILGEIMEKCIYDMNSSDSNKLLSSQQTALKHYILLKNNVQLMKEIMI
ncbi:hypothetical protein L9F63_006829 [Diploptera punctata]|uniref:Clathrin/coatomer adaptor adaptin-like N-terminal domain-containing protein n=1 Tax=Diploptera punctata TaxID=6984 RepID=A0AAD8E4C2_DIPPU|nr:hypothetical protein L9F63_006829 [Diploptera punctata]